MKPGPAPLCITLLILCEQRVSEKLQNYHSLGRLCILNVFQKFLLTPQVIAIGLRTSKYIRDFLCYTCSSVSSQCCGGSTFDYASWQRPALYNGTHREHTTPLYQKKVTQSARSFHQKRRLVDCTFQCSLPGPPIVQLLRLQLPILSFQIRSFLSAQPYLFVFDYAADGGSKLPQIWYL